MENPSFEPRPGPGSYDDALAPPPTVSAGSLLRRALRIFFRHAPPLLGVALVCHLPTLLAIVGRDIDDPDKFSIAFMINMIANSLIGHVVNGLLAYYVFMQLSGKRIGVLPALLVGLRRLLPVLAVGLLVAITTSFGYRFLLVPGLMLSAMLYVSIPAVVVERTSVFRALGRSKDLTHGHKWSIFGVSCVLGLGILAIAAIVVVSALALMADASTELRLTGLVYVYWAFSVLSAAITAVATAVAYHDLRHLKEGTQIDELTAVFD